MKASGAVAKVLILFCLLQLSTAWREFNDLTVKTNAFGLDKSEAFYDIPTDSINPLFEDYVRAEPEPGFKFQMDFYCHHADPRVCFMYDKKGNVAGVQISFLKEDVANIKPEHYDYAKNPNYVQTNFFNKPAYSTRVYFTNPGQHYIYKYNKDSSCKDLYVLFPLYEKGGLVGIGVAAPGSGSKGPHRDWYEKPTGEVMKVVTPNPPSCKDISQKYAHSTVHVFLVDKPWEIGCP